MQIWSIRHSSTSFLKLICSFLYSLLATELLSSKLTQAVAVWDHILEVLGSNLTHDAMYLTEV
jgi:hypothetical protein